MSNNINNTKQITLFMEDCKSIGVDVLGPDVNESQYAFAVNDKGQIRFGLGAVSYTHLDVYKRQILYRLRLQPKMQIFSFRSLTIQWQKVQVC